MVAQPQVGAVPVTDLPVWLVNGVILGIVAAAGVLFVYLVGLRWFDLGRPAGQTHDPDGLRRTEVRAYLAAIGEAAVEDVAIEGTEVAFWLPDRAVAITFDAGAYFRLRDAGVTTVLLEHEVPGDRIGNRLPFDTPSVETHRPVDDGATWARSVLDVPVDAPEAVIERAYRERIKEVHPDVGGDATDLIEVIEAYEQLSG